MYIQNKSLLFIYFHPDLLFHLSVPHISCLQIARIPRSRKYTRIDLQTSGLNQELNAEYPQVAVDETMGFKRESQ